MKSQEQKRYEQTMRERVALLRQALAEAEQDETPLAESEWTLWVERTARCVFELGLAEWVNERAEKIASALDGLNNLGLPRDFIVAILANNRKVKRAGITKTSVEALLDALEETLRRLRR